MKIFKYILVVLVCNILNGLNYEIYSIDKNYLLDKFIPPFFKTFTGQSHITNKDNYKVSLCRKGNGSEKLE